MMWIWRIAVLLLLAAYLPALASMLVGLLYELMNSGLSGKLVWFFHVAVAIIFVIVLLGWALVKKWDNARLQILITVMSLYLGVLTIYIMGPVALIMQPIDHERSYGTYGMTEAIARAAGRAVSLFSPWLIAVLVSLPVLRRLLGRDSNPGHTSRHNPSG